MQITKFILAAAAILSLSACLNTDGDRAIAGAVGGALVSDALGGNALTGAVVGAAAGALCDDAGLCN